MCNSGSFKLWVGWGDRCRTVVGGEEGAINVSAVVAAHGYVAKCERIQIITVVTIVEYYIACSSLGAYEHIVHGQVVVVIFINREAVTAVRRFAKSECCVSCARNRTIYQIEYIVSVYTHLCVFVSYTIVGSFCEVVCAYVELCEGSVQCNRYCATFL